MEKASCDVSTIRHCCVEKASCDVSAIRHCCVEKTSCDVSAIRHCCVLESVILYTMHYLNLIGSNYIIIALYVVLSYKFVYIYIFYIHYIVHVVLCHCCARAFVPVANSTLHPRVQDFFHEQGEFGIL